MQGVSPTSAVSVVTRTTGPSSGIPAQAVVEYEHESRHAGTAIAKLAHSLGGYDTNVMGMVGEVIAEETLGMAKAPAQSKDIDGHLLLAGERRSLQVKTLSAARLTTYGRGAKFRVAAGVHPEQLLVLVVFPRAASYKVAYFGPTTSVGKLELVNGTERRGVCIHHLFVGRDHEMEALLRECREER